MWFFLQYYTDTEAFSEALLDLGYIPAEPFSLTKAFTSMFMHGSWGHLIFNMWALWVFGDNVEDVLGKIWYGIVYFASGLVALMTHAYLYSESLVPVVGASGAISGIMGAYLTLFPRAKILAYIPPLFFQMISARFFLVLWFILQLLQGVIDKLSNWVSGETGGIAFWAHIGGFAGGWLLSQLARPSPSEVDRWDYLR
ncbi:MAG: rhomboid family intramembrane serine protease [Bacteroidia bacterium]|nr:rhomboid family intramembrane serine protease [Bacteroidia bacterium]MCX7651250.1 rhomboid family intramembrane serine protease [Bacteroidia bacterium]